MGIHYGGLAGKARHLHVRRSADRHYSNQLIAEYYDPGGDEDRPVRVIPIRSRSEFLPSAMAFSAADRRVGGQLSLPLDDRSTVAGPEWSSQRAEKRDLQRAVATNQGVSEHGAATGHRADRPPVAASSVNQVPKNPTTIPFPRPARRGNVSPLPMDWAVRSGRRQTGVFTFRGFVTGFAVGSAAAAVLLLFLNAAM